MKSIKSDFSDELKQQLLLQSPTLVAQDGCRLAAVALVIRSKNGQPEILFIQRASFENDPWSGQIALPGGGKEMDDMDMLDTAIRETHEEVGVVLHRDQLIGQLDDQRGRSNNQDMALVISCYVFSITHDPTLCPNEEVAEAFWFPLHHLRDASRSIAYQTTYREEPYSAIDLGYGESGQPLVLWGLTQRFIQMLMDMPV